MEARMHDIYNEVQL